VPGDQPTIQAAINAASAGDTVLVAPGTYVENINFQGKAITVTSSGGPSVTRIDGGASGTVVTFNHSEGASSVLSGFTIRNGKRNGGFGGGISISGASPTITANVITGNHAAVGPGIYVSGGSPLIQGNTITGNNQLASGSGYQGGGGIAVDGSSSTPGNPQIIGNSITNNSVASGGIGGGISATLFSSPLIQNNLIQGNSAYNYGGGIALQSRASPVVVQNVIVGNSSQFGGSGGGMWVAPDSLAPTSVQTISNNTISSNTAFDNTAGIVVDGVGQKATFANNIVVAAQTAVTCKSSTAPTFSNNDALSTSGTTWTGICAPVAPPGNISADPKFLSASDFHLQWGSPAVDVGTNSASGLPSMDFSGNPRIVDGNSDGTAVVDLGAYELSPTTITLAPANLTFAAQHIGSTSAAQTVTLTNAGSASLPFSIAIDAGFAQTNNCGTLLAVGASCSINITFSPTATGTWSGNLTLKDSASGNPHTVSVVGTGGAPAATLSLSSLDFGSIPIGITSASQAVTLSNTGDDIMAVAGITTNGDFAKTSTCGATLAAGAGCSISVTFAPAAAGSRSGFVNVDDNSPGAPHQVSLSGLGVTPAPAPTIWTQPVSQTVGIGQTATFTVGATSTAPLNYQWKKNNVSIPGATSASYTTPPVTIYDDGATYKVGIQNSLGGVTSNIVTLSVPHTSASIATQPVDVTVLAGQTATFGVVGAGTTPLIYQWRKNNVSIGGATSASYTTPPVTLADNGGTYVVSVQNSFSGATSNIVTLNVTAPTAPVITVQPFILPVTPGVSAFFAVAATGTGPLFYQWRKNNVSIPGATSSFYVTPPATLADNGTQYVVSVSNSLSGVTSNVVTLIVTGAATTPPTITTQPVSRTAGIGQTATFTVVATSTAPLTYQWKKNNASIPGATSASYTTPPATINDDGATYKVGIQNNLGGVTSNVVTLSVPHTAASITTQPVDVTVGDGQKATFTVVGAGTTPLIYQWRKNNISIAGANSASYTTPPTTLADDGATYVVSVQNSFSGVTSNVVTLHVTPLAIGPFPASVHFRWTQKFTATAPSRSPAARAVVWSVNGVAGGSAAFGTIDGSGLYTAPAVAPSPAIVTISAVDQLDATLTASTSVQLTGLFVYATDQGNGSGNGGLWGYSVNANGTLTALPNSPVAQPKPYYAVADSQGKHLYVADISSFGTNYVYIYTIDPVTGALTPAGTTAVGSGARQITIDPSGTRLYGDVMDGSAAGIHGFNIDPSTGALTPLIGSPFANSGSRPASISFDPTGKFAFASNNASGNISAFSVNSATGQLTAIGAFAAGRAPQWAITDGSGAHLYVQDGLDSVIYAYDIGSTGALTPLSTPTFGGVSSALTSALSPNGKFLYVPNWVGSGSNPGTTSVFSISSPNGILTPIAGSPFVTGKFPTFVAIESSGQFAFVANELAGTVQTFSLNSVTGAMSPLSSAPTGITPTIIAIATTKP